MLDIDYPPAIMRVALDVALEVLAGAAVIFIIGNEVLLFGLPVQLQIIVKGLVIVLAAALSARRAN
jgi:ribose/xylose/arabinose/galactoside ABC-type transport system permease subunit